MKLGESVNLLVKIYRVSKTKKEFELDSQSKFNQEMQAEFHERIKKLGEKNGS